MNENNEINEICVKPKEGNEASKSSKTSLIDSFDVTSLLSNYDGVDLNEKVSKILLLGQGKEDEKGKGSLRRRTRMTKSQTDVLEKYYLRYGNFTETILKHLNKKMKLPKSKLYKWNWDRRNKIM